MAVYLIKIGDDQQLISVSGDPPSIVQEFKDATTFRQYVGIVERRIPSPFPTIEIARRAALRAIDSTPHLTDEQRAAARAQILGATEYDRIVFDGPYPIPQTGGPLDQGGKLVDGAPIKPPLVIVFLDP